MRVVVIGCGVVGAAIAYELSQSPHLSITVLEQQAHPASAATGAALGVLMGAISTKPKGHNLRMRLFGIQQYNEWVPHLEAVTHRQIQFNQQGILRLCWAGEEMARWHRLVSLRQQQGWELQVCDRADLAAHYPHLNLNDVIGAVYAPGDRQIDPTALTWALMAAAQQQGTVCQFNTTVDRIVPLERSLQLHTSTGIIETDWLVVAAGIGSTRLTSELPQPVDVRPVLGQAVRVKLPQPLGDSMHQPVITGNDVHLVPLGNGEYWIGATVEFGEAMQDWQKTPLQPNAAMLEAVMQQAIALCPALQNATILHQWYGLRPRPEGRPAPIIETLSGDSRILLATGHYRNGVLLAPATAQRVKEMVTGMERNPALKHL